MTFLTKNDKTMKNIILALAVIGLLSACETDRSRTYAACTPLTDSTAVFDYTGIVDNNKKEKISEVYLFGNNQLLDSSAVAPSSGKYHFSVELKLRENDNILGMINKKISKEEYNGDNDTYRTINYVQLYRPSTDTSGMLGKRQCLISCTIKETSRSTAFLYNKNNLQTPIDSVIGDKGWHTFKVDYKRNAHYVLTVRNDSTNEVDTIDNDVFFERPQFYKVISIY